MRAIFMSGLAVYLFGITIACACAQDSNNSNTNTNFNLNSGSQLNGGSWQSHWSTSSSTATGGTNTNTNQNTNQNWVDQSEHQPSPSQFSNQFFKQWQQQQAQRQEQQPEQQTLPVQPPPQATTQEAPKIGHESNDSGAHIFDSFMEKIFYGWINTSPSSHEYSVDTPGAPKSEMVTTATGAKYEVVTGGVNPNFKIIGPFASMSATKTLEMYERQLQQDRPGSTFSAPIVAAGKGWTGVRTDMAQQGLPGQIVIAAKAGWTPLVYILMAPIQPPADANRFISSFVVDPAKAWEAHPTEIAEARSQILLPLVGLLLLVLAIAGVGLTRSKRAGALSSGSPETGTEA